MVAIQGPFIPRASSPPVAPSPVLAPPSLAVPKAATLSSVFIGFRRDSLHIRRSILERDLLLEDRPPVGVILSEVISRPQSQASRVLSKWPLDNDDTWVSTSRVPIDVTNEGYRHHSTDFRGIASLRDVLGNPDGSPQIASAPLSTILTTFIADAQMPDRQPLFIIYICTKVNFFFCHILLAKGVTCSDRKI
jgi:hypothetical protein